MKILSPSQTAEALPYARLVPAVAQAALELAGGRIKAPERQVVTIDAASVLLCMPAVGSDLSVVKLVTVHANNAQHALPAIQGEVIVFDTATGRRLALLDGPTVTARRTAAVTLLGIEALAARRPSSVLIIGTGTQASAHADALAEFLGINEFWIAGIDVPAAEAFIASLRRRHPQVAAQATTAAQLQFVLPATDVVIALTTARTPVIPARIAPHTLAIGIGAFKPDMAEFPPELLHRRRIVVDDPEGARHEAGDLIQAGIDWTGVRGLASILDAGIERTGEAPVFKTVGQAAWDLAAARVAVSSLRD